MANKPLPPTKDGYRYYWGEDDPALCWRYKQAINSNDALKRLAFTRRKLVFPYVKLSENDRAPQLKMEGEFTVTGEKGYSMVRATHSANRGRFYYEVTIDRMKYDPKVPSNHMNAARIGWAQKYANLQAPLGYDTYGYSYRSRFGTKFHKAHGKTYHQGGGYGEGDVIGCMIELPYGNSRNLTEAHHLPESVKEKCFVLAVPKKKENAEKPRQLEGSDVIPKDMKPLEGSKISFYKNGKFLGVAFDNIYEGSYFPTISLYKNCRVTVNFGPKFRYPPPQIGGGDQKTDSSLPWLPVNDLAQLEMIDNLLSDLLFVVSEEIEPSTAELKQLIELTQTMT